MIAFTTAGLSNLTAFARAEVWSGITIDVKATQPVVASQRLEEMPDGFQRLGITLSNQGEQPATIESITVKVPITDAMANDLQVIYGSNCMGSTHLLRQDVGAPTKESSSKMFQMVRLNDEKYIFMGALSWRIFMPEFTTRDGAFIISSKGEGKQLKPGETVRYEQIVLRHADNWVDLLSQFGDAIARENNVGKLKKDQFKGWASWDYYAYKFSAKDLHDNALKVRNLDPSANLIQIDAGWYTVRGDYAERPDLDGGMKGIADKIKAAGMTPGIWVDGFRANTDSAVCKSHPEYFLHDQDGKMIVQVRRPEGIDRDRIYFDYSHPGARAHIAKCIRTIVKDLGFPYVKIDFMRFGLNEEILKANPKVKSIKSHDPTLTDVERMRLGLQAMRDAVGPENYLLGCSAVIGPCIGFVDGMRTGGDINPRFEAFPERCLGNLSHFYLTGKVFNGDADYLVFREAADEDDKVSKEETKHGGSMTLNEAQMWADFNKLYGNCRLSGDNLTTLRPERQALVKEVFDFPVMDETVPLDLWEHGSHKGDGFELVLARKGADVFLGVFNWGETEKEFPLKDFGKAEPVRLKGRHSVVLKYDGKDSFAELCRKLQTR